MKYDYDYDNDYDDDIFYMSTNKSNTLYPKINNTHVFETSR